MSDAESWFQAGSWSVFGRPVLVERAVVDAACSQRGPDRVDIEATTGEFRRGSADRLGVFDGARPFKSVKRRDRRFKLRSDRFARRVGLGIPGGVRGGIHVGLMGGPLETGL